MFVGAWKHVFRRVSLLTLPARGFPPRRLERSTSTSPDMGDGADVGELQCVCCFAVVMGGGGVGHGYP